MTIVCNLSIYMCVGMAKKYRFGCGSYTLVKILLLGDLESGPALLQSNKWHINLMDFATLKLISFVADYSSLM